MREHPERLKASDDASQRQAIPLWEANLDHAGRERETLAQDRRSALRDLVEAQRAQAEYRLLAAARIEVAPQ